MESKTFSSGQNPDVSGYDEALEWLYSQLPLFSRIGGAAYKPGLENTEKLDELFEHPHRQFKTIHVAGTNGKGSTSHMIASILQSQGYKTGLYTSPHLVDFRERMRIDGKMIPHSKVIDFVDRWKKMGRSLHPSFFELTMMMAFDWFASEKVDYAVIEVGMGGRLDSTNVIYPEACIITNISKDHTQFLGDTPEKIASEKAGIIKKGIPVVIGEAEGVVKEVFRNRSAEVGAPIDFAEDHSFLLEIERDSTSSMLCKAVVNFPGERENCSYEKNNPKVTAFTFRTPLTGEYQIKNINTVLHAVRMLNEVGISIDIESVIKGMEEVNDRTGFRGRWTVMNDSPLVIADTGHNEAGISSNLKRLEEILSQHPSGRLHMVFGMVADKDIDHILKLLPKDAVYYLTQASIPRALNVELLGEKAKSHGLTFTTFHTVGRATEVALSNASPEDIVYIGGSTFIVADYLAFIELQSLTNKIS